MEPFRDRLLATLPEDAGELLAESIEGLLDEEEFNDFNFSFEVGR